MAVERSRLADLMTNVQKMQNDIERSTESDRRRLETQIQTLESQRYFRDYCYSLSTLHFSSLAKIYVPNLIKNVILFDKSPYKETWKFKRCDWKLIER